MQKWGLSAVGLSIRVERTYLYSPACLRTFLKVRSTSWPRGTSRCKRDFQPGPPKIGFNEAIVLGSSIAAARFTKSYIKFTSTSPGVCFKTLSNALQGYLRCLSDSNGHDDCATEFRSLTKAQSEFESAVSKDERECR